MKAKWIRRSKRLPNTNRFVWVTYLSLEKWKFIIRDRYDTTLKLWNSRTNVIA